MAEVCQIFGNIDLIDRYLESKRQIDSID